MYHLHPFLRQLLFTVNVLLLYHVLPNCQDVIPLTINDFVVMNFHSGTLQRIPVTCLSGTILFRCHTLPISLGGLDYHTELIPRYSMRVNQSFRL